MPYYGNSEAWRSIRLWTNTYVVQRRALSHHGSSPSVVHSTNRLQFGYQPSDRSTIALGDNASNISASGTLRTIKANPVGQEFIRWFRSSRGSRDGQTAAPFSAAQPPGGPLGPLAYSTAGTRPPFPVWQPPVTAPTLSVVDDVLRQNYGAYLQGKTIGSTQLPSFRLQPVVFQSPAPHLFDFRRGSPPSMRPFASGP